MSVFRFVAREGNFSRCQVKQIGKLWRQNIIINTQKNCHWCPEGIGHLEQRIVTGKSAFSQTSFPTWVLLLLLFCLMYSLIILPAIFVHQLLNKRFPSVSYPIYSRLAQTAMGWKKQGKMISHKVRSRESSVAIKSKYLLKSAFALICQNTKKGNCGMSLLSRRFIKTRWTNTQNTNKKMTIHWFHSIAIQHKYQNHNTALSSLSVNARHASASPKWTVMTNASHAVHSLQQRCLLSGSFFFFK